VFLLNVVENLIKKSTMAILPAYHEIYRTIILDQSGEKVYSYKSTMEILEEACIAYGADYDGRIKAVRYALKYNRKTPLMICPLEIIYAFPTMSPDNFDCIWLFNRHIDSFSKDNGQSYVHFKNGEKIAVNCSLDVLTRQRQRTAVTMMHFSQPPFVTITVNAQGKEAFTKE
jgi:competence protein ComK